MTSWLGGTLSDDERSVVADVRAALFAERHQTASDAFHAIITLGFWEGSCSDAFVDELGNVFESDMFAGSAWAAHLVHALMATWDAITPLQRSRVLLALENAFPHLVDDVTAFVVMELIGTHYADEQGLAAVERLIAATPAVQRAAIPHGLEMIAKEASKQSVVLAAYNALVRMQREESAAVRAEAHEALVRTAKRYPPYPRPGGTGSSGSLS